MPSPFGDTFDPLKRYNEQAQTGIQGLGALVGTGDDPLAALRQQRSYGGTTGGVSYTGAPGAAGSYAPYMLESAADIANRFGVRNPGGYRAKGSVANSDHPHWRAYDFMTGSNKGQGWNIANYMVGNAGRYNVKYVIFDNRIWKPGSGWRPYSHPHGNSPTLRHEDHVHVSYN